ncbi:hypothetical protein N658DRAFT_568404 [Parathielavia hyrcaniae]|uniref:Riboflavin kinase n=1 Tax=Parathielavia hyrcaniae TaxID=113614 RepID=A0AAN6SZY2_9PEZI|nr:hypothetical protein N658DRAFT_568404 [Parathielavia hyrcaniae]
MMEMAAPMQIRRKPVALAALDPDFKSSDLPPYAAPSESHQKPPQIESRLRPTEYPQLPSRPVSRGADPFLQTASGHGLRPQRSMPELSRAAADSPLDNPQWTTAATFGPEATAGKKNFVQSALSEARHFAGGLIPHPTESTKHYTILRHSAPLVFYRGPSTSVAITIFTSPDRALPDDRTLWLQQRGYSGDSGMKIKAFFNATDDWLHVTPSTQVGPHQLSADTDRAWQRDIAKAAKKLLQEMGPKKAHVPRETHVIRIPEASEDGYFRLNMCTGRGAPNGTNEPSSKCKTLCGSPIFRLASASTDSSVFRGASLTSLPLEMGVFVASVVATTTADRYIAPVRDPVQAVMDKVRPGFVTETVGGLVADHFNENSAERDAERDHAFVTAHQAHVTRSHQADPNAIHPIGPDSGPEPPFPLQFQAKVVQGTGRSQAELGVPTANLAGVPDEIRYRLSGIYFGWARVPVQPNSKGSSSSKVYNSPTSPTFPLPPHMDTQWQWHETILTIAPDPSSAPSVKPKPLVTAHLLNLHPPATTGNILLNQTLTVLILGLLRPNPNPQPTNPFLLKGQMDAASRDACLALVSLARGNWRADAPVVTAGLMAAAAATGRGGNSSSSGGGSGLLNLGGKVDGVKERVMAKVVGSSSSSRGPVPLHRVGVRMGGGGGAAGERDRVLGVGGYWVAR